MKATEPAVIDGLGSEAVTGEALVGSSGIDFGAVGYVFFFEDVLCVHGYDEGASLASLFAFLIGSAGLGAAGAQTLGFEFVAVAFTFHVFDYYGGCVRSAGLRWSRFVAGGLAFLIGFHSLGDGERERLSHDFSLGFRCRPAFLSLEHDLPLFLGPYLPAGPSTAQSTDERLARIVRPDRPATLTTPLRHLSPRTPL